MSSMSRHFPSSNVIFAASVGVSLVLAGCKGGSSSEKAAPPVPAETVPAIPGEVVRVEVNDHGFQPSTVPVGTGRRLMFRRTSEGTCATEVVFPELGINKQLPLNTDVVVDLPASAKGDVAFQCGMGMYKSKVVAR